MNERAPMPPPGCRLARHCILEGQDRLRLHALDWGSPGAPPLVFLHGGAAHAHWFDAVAPAFADRFHVLALDQRGHGESAWAGPAAYGTEDFAADLLAVAGALGAPVRLIGHSMGGHNAMAFAAWHPDRVAALAILDARPAISPERLGRMRERGRRPPRTHRTLEDAARAFRLLPPETVADPALLAHLARESYASCDGGYAVRFDPACYASRRPVDAWPLLAAITAPTLVLRARHSPVLPGEMAARLQAAIPRASLLELPDAHHHVVLDRPAAVVAALTAFLDGLPQPGGGP